MDVKCFRCKKAIISSSTIELRNERTVGIIRFPTGIPKGENWYCRDCERENRAVLCKCGYDVKNGDRIVCPNCEKLLSDYK